MEIAYYTPFLYNNHVDGYNLIFPGGLVYGHYPVVEYHPNAMESMKADCGEYGYSLVSEGEYKKITQKGVCNGHGV